jgi:hypothetical protein
MERLPDVEGLSRVIFYGVFARGADDFVPLSVPVDDREGRTVNRYPILDGRRASPDAADEIMFTESTAARLGYEVGDRIRLQTFAPDQADAFEQEELPDFAGPEPTVTVVGITRTGQDIVSRAEDLIPAIGTPAFYRRYGGEILEFATSANVLLGAGAAGVPAFQEEVVDLAGPDADVRIESISSYTDPLRKAVDVVAVGLWIFAGTAALASIVALGVVLGRQAFFGARDDATLAGMGMSRARRFTANFIPVAMAATVGAALGVVAASLASSLMPVGNLARRIEPDRGVDVDPVVLGLGFIAVVAVALGLAAAAGWSESGRATAPAPARARPGTSWHVAKRLANTGAGPVIVTGVRMALEPGRGRTAVPVRPALVGAVAGIAGLVAALTFGAGLDRLTSSPSRYGFGWDVSVAGADPDDLRSDPDIAAVAEGVFQLPVSVEGQPVTAAGIRQVEGEVFTTVVKGRPARAADEIVLGADTLDHIGRSIGDTVDVTGPTGTSRFRIVGQGVFPSPEDPYPLADGAAVTGDGVDALGLNDFPDAFLQHLVSWRHGIDEDAARSRLAERYDVSEPSAPPDVTRLDQVTVLPQVLAGLLGFLGVVAVGYALVTAVHRRRRDFAVLETLGFVGRQVSATVAWQASTLAVVGVLLGVPLGLVAGRWAWILVAEGLGIATDTAVPVVALVTAVPVALLVANAVAFVPGRMAARTRPAVVLRSE